MNIQDWFPLGWTGWISLQSKGLLQHHSSKASILRCSAFFIVKLSHPYMTTGKTIALTRWSFASNVKSLLFNMLSGFVIAFLPRSTCLWFSWLQSPSVVILECYIHESDELEVVKQEMARVNNDILGISELKWTGMGELSSDDHYIYSVGKNPLEKME